MRHEIVLSPEAIEDLKSLRASDRAALRDAFETHLRSEPTKTSRSRIKRLRGSAKPTFRLRAGNFGVFYDVTRAEVQILAVILKSEGECMARKSGKAGVKRVPLSEVKDDLSRYLHLAEEDEIVITRHGMPAGVLIGFGSEEAWFEYRLENDPRFLARIEKARMNLRRGRGKRLEDAF